MNNGMSRQPRNVFFTILPSQFLRRRLIIIFCAFLCGLLPVSAQAQKLPSPDKIVDSYVKAVGGKKRLAAMRDASYEWTVRLDGQPFGTARTEIRSPSYSRWRITPADAGTEIAAGASTNAAWERAADGTLKTLTDRAAWQARLAATLLAGKLVDYKKSNVQARTVGAEKVNGAEAYVVEFSFKSGAQLRYWFDARSKLPLQFGDDTGAQFRFADFRAPENAKDAPLEPHRIEQNVAPYGWLTFHLTRAVYNQNLAVSLFDAPPATEAIDIPALLRAITENQKKLDERVGNYSYTMSEIEREIDSKGIVKKETRKIYEVFPLSNRRTIFKLISENGVPLTGDKLAKEDKRVAEAVAKAEREQEQEKQKAADKEREKLSGKNNGTRGGKGDDEDEDRDLSLSTFLRVSEFVSPRRERFRERDVIVFDFRARPNYKPNGREETLISKLIGTVWIDPEDKEIMRLEARFAEGFKVGGGLLFSIKPGAAFVAEQARMTDGVWLPRYAQANLSYKILLFGGGDVNTVREFSDYRRYNTETQDYKINNPQP